MLNSDTTTGRTGGSLHQDKESKVAGSGEPGALERDAAPPLRLIETLCEQLRLHDIDYCHWKSNDVIFRSANGENDLDLLVAREDSVEFAAILARLGFKHGNDPPDKRLPGVSSFYGADAETHKIVHIHAHFQLILGHDFTKNYRIPIEKAYLQSARQEGLFRIPSPELELAIFVIRMVLKHGTWESKLIRHGSLSTAEKRERDYLLSRAHAEQLGEVLARHFPSIDQVLFERLVGALRGEGSRWRQLRAASELVRRLRPYSRRSRPWDLCVKFWRRVAIPFRTRILKRTAKARLSSGGMLLAVVGGDGAGKTTAIDGLRNWLSQELDAITTHMGKPKWSLATTTVRGILKAGRSLGLYPYHRTEPEYNRDSTALTFPGYPWAIRECCTARDRYRTYVKARRIVAEGGIVICDRFPLPEIELMDGPQIRRFAAGRVDNRLIRLMIRAEESYYAKMRRPELVAVLKVDPELAVARKTDESEVTVRPRSSEIWSIDWDQVDADVMDASQPKEKVLSELKTLVWSRL
jgi:thymidylate kinase